MKKRWLVLNIFVMLAIIVSSSLIIHSGNVYDIPTHYYPERKSLENITVKFSQENVLQTDKISLNNMGEVIVRVRAVGHGDVITKIFIDDNRTTVSSQFHVTNTKTIFEQKFDGLNFMGFRFVMWELLTILTAIEVIMLWSFFECKIKSDFSDKRVAYGGIILFNLGLLLLSIVRILTVTVKDFAQFEEILQQSGRQLLIVLIPVMFLLSLAIAVGNVVALKHKKENIRNNILGIVIGVVWCVLTAVSLILNRQYNDVGIVSAAMEDLNTMLAYIMAYFECLLLSSCICTVVERFSHKEKVWYTFPNTCLRRFKNVFVHQLLRHITVLVPIALFFIFT